MSLPEAVLQIADDVEKDSRDSGLMYDDLVLRLEINVRLLRMAVKASQGNPSPQPPSPLFDQLPVDKAQRLAAKKVEQELEHRAQMQEGGTRMVLILGGPDDGTMVPINGKMPVGARTSIGNLVYELKLDGRLELIPDSIPPRKVIT